MKHTRLDIDDHEWYDQLNKMEMTCSYYKRNINEGYVMIMTLNSSTTNET